MNFVTVYVAVQRAVLKYRTFYNALKMLLEATKCNLNQKFYIVNQLLMALFKIVVWAIVFLTKLRFPPGILIATICLYIKKLNV